MDERIHLMRIELTKASLALQMLARRTEFPFDEEELLVVARRGLDRLLDLIEELNGSLLPAEYVGPSRRLEPGANGTAQRCMDEWRFRPDDDNGTYICAEEEIRLLEFA